MIATSIDTCTRSAYDISECSSMSVAHGRSGPNLATLTASAAYSSIGAADGSTSGIYLNAIWRVRWLVNSPPRMNRSAVEWRRRWLRQPEAMSLKLPLWEERILPSSRSWERGRNTIKDVATSATAWTHGYTSIARPLRSSISWSAGLHSGQS